MQYTAVHSYFKIGIDADGPRRWFGGSKGSVMGRDLIDSSSLRALAQIADMGKFEELRRVM